MLRGERVAPPCEAMKLSRVLLAPALAVVFALHASAAGRLKVQVFDVGQGDAILVTCPDGKHQLLIDSGCNKYPGSQTNFHRELSAALATDQNHTLELAVASHPHSDHLGGMFWVLTNFHVGTYLDNGLPYTTDLWKKVQAEREAQTNAHTLKYLAGSVLSGKQIDFCPLIKITVIEPAAANPKLKNPNDLSVCLRIDYQSRSFLFVGDLEDKAEATWLNKLTPELRKLADVDVLKVGHHGSDTSSTPAFVALVSPRLALISCGAPEVGTNSGYMHPRLSTIETYRAWFTAHPPAAIDPATKQLSAYDAVREGWVKVSRPQGLYLTVLDGNLTVETDGTDIFVNKTK